MARQSLTKKQCIDCLQFKSESDFTRRTDTGKLRGQCKECISKRRKEYCLFNWEFIKEGKLRWQRENPDKKTKISRRYYDSHRDEIRTYNREYKRNKQSLEARIISNYRGRIWKALKRGDKSATTMELLGCSIECLKEHLANQFDANMTWDNYGEWHVDHIIPCASFDFTKESEQRKCFHYTNLQPLWELPNKRKSNKVEYIYGRPTSVTC